jgi:DNA-binding response OmpR family regulator
MPESRPRILVVEDDASLAKALGLKFTHEQFDVLTAKDGKEGLKMALEYHPDIILLDIVMPILDGMTMLKRLRQDTAWGKDAKVILLTNLSDAGNVAGALEHSVRDYLVKSQWKIADVVKKVRERLQP